MNRLVHRTLGHVPDAVLRALPSDLRADVHGWGGRYVPGDVDYDVEVPPVHPGERTGPPDFILFGGDDVGGHWWMSMLGHHPEVAPCRSVAAASHFFARFATRDFDDDAVAAFHTLFPRRPGRIIGHWSPDGLLRPWVLPLLARAAPRAQILALVRDPVERLSAASALTSAERAPHVGSHAADAVDHGLAGEQITRLAEFFPPEQVRILQYERCVADPAAALTGSFAALGLEEDRPPVTTTPPTDPPADLDPATRARLRQLYAADVALLADLVPDVDLDLWPNFGTAW